MFLYQKFNYKVVNLDEVDNIKDTLVASTSKISVFDTETTGLNFMIDTPFLLTFGTKNPDIVYYLTKLTEENIKQIYDFLIENNLSLFAQNAKYDWHIMFNNKTPIPKNIKLCDGQTVARLTSYADEELGVGLEALGIKYVDKEAKFAGAVIKKKINEINAERLRNAKSILKKEFPKARITEVFTAYKKRVQFIEYPEYDEMFKVIDNNYKKPNYYDVYKASPSLMISYALDDVVILLEYLNKALPIIDKINANKVFEQECALISTVGNFERNGLRADVSYLLNSRNVVKEYIDKKYEELWEITGSKISSGQHKEIMKIMANFSVYMTNCDADALENVTKTAKNPKAVQMAETIIELRTLDKWLSTYIEGMLNRITNGRVYTSINNSGAVTGRVSSDMQQQPKEGLFTKTGEELFHPRKVFINDENGKMYFFDFSQMELRLQAEYTILVSGGDINLCRAFVPFKCKSMFTGEIFNWGDDYSSNEWLDDENNVWKPTDLHTATTLKAFPTISVDGPNFGHYRRLGKMCNFLKNYGGGIGALTSSLKVSDEIANALNNGYYQAFPKILDYQKWVEKTLTTKGYIENVFGRRYYIRSALSYFKGYNYLIQGGCADIVKNKEIRISKLLEGKKSKILLPVHDEVIVFISDEEKYLIKEIKEIMDDNKEFLEYIPLTCDIEYTDTNWGDKLNYE